MSDVAEDEIVRQAKLSLSKAILTMIPPISTGDERPVVDAIEVLITAVLGALVEGANERLETRLKDAKAS